MASSLNFPLNIISWAEASSRVPNHWVCYILRDHLANPMNWGALIIIKPSGKAPTHPRLVCVYKDEWTEVQWNPEDKTYSLRATIPQLDKYDTEGSNIQILIDKELEKTSEEDTASEAESEEELKEPGSSIDQQICLTPIAQSLKASPMDTKNSPFTSDIAMTTQTATYTGTAITSSQPAPSSSSSSNTTPQQQLLTFSTWLLNVMLTWKPCSLAEHGTCHMISLIISNVMLTWIPCGLASALSTW